MQNHNWRSDVPSKWDMIATGKWIQKAVWNRWVTESERDQSHKTPITSTWTVDFLTREGEGRKAIGAWLRDKTVPWSNLQLLNGLGIVVIYNTLKSHKQVSRLQDRN